MYDDFTNRTRVYKVNRRYAVLGSGLPEDIHRLLDRIEELQTYLISPCKSTS